MKNVTRAAVLSTLTIATATFRVLVRDKILYNVLFVSLFLIVIGYWASQLVFGHQDRVMLHFGQAINFLAILAIAISAGSRSVPTEIESRTLYLVLSKPISRVHYWGGKFLGIGFFLALNSALLTAVVAVGVRLTLGEPNIGYLQSATLLWLEGWMITAFAMWISLKFTPALNAMLCLTILFIGHNFDQIAYLKQKDAIGSGTLNFLTTVIPRCDRFVLDTGVYYGMFLDPAEWWIRVGYGLIWIIMVFSIGNAFFYRKNL